MDKLHKEQRKARLSSRTTPNPRSQSSPPELANQPKTEFAEQVQARLTNLEPQPSATQSLDSEEESDQELDPDHTLTIERPQFMNSPKKTEA